MRVLRLAMKFIRTVVFFFTSFSFLYAQQNISNEEIISRLGISNYSSNKNIINHNDLLTKISSNLEKTNLLNSNSQIDSVISIKANGSKYKSTFTYNSDKRWLVILEERWNENKWVEKNRKTFEYDINGFKKSYLVEFRSDSSWRYDYRVNYIYDEDGNELLYFDEHWLNNQWWNNHRYTRTYNSSGNLLTELFEQTISGTNDFRNYERSFYQYSSSGLVDSVLTENWDGIQWKNSLLMTYAYDEYENIIQLIFSNSPLDQWYNFARYDYTYDSEGNRTSELYSRRTSGVWNNEWEFIFTYDSNGNMTSETKKYWNQTGVSIQRSLFNYDANNNLYFLLRERWENNQWVNSGRYFYNYNSNGQKISELREYWEESIWKFDWLYTFTFDAYQNLINWKFDYSGSGNWASDDSYISYSDSFGNNITLWGTEILFYYDPTTDITEKNTSVKSFFLSQNYPNPFNPSTNIPFSINNATRIKLEVYNPLGELVTELVNEFLEAGKYQYQFNAAGLPSGIYFYNLSANEKLLVKKMILVK